MKVSQSVGVIILLSVATVTLVGIVGLVWLYLNVQPYMADRKLDGEMLRLQAAANRYYSLIETYEGVCKDVGVYEPFVCNESKDAFAVSVELSNRNHLCIDNTGHYGEQAFALRSEPVCTK